MITIDTEDVIQMDNINSYFLHKTELLQVYLESNRKYVRTIKTSLMELGTALKLGLCIQSI